ncbi:MAG: hypothetical protein ABJA78_05880 [Ferruginibacter sp.]
MLKKLFACFIISCCSFVSQAQNVIDLNENEAYKENGLEYGYYISNESNKSVKGEDYDRYEVILYVNNKSGCIKIIPFRTSILNSSSDETVVADFTIKNATGKRLTSKSGKVNAKPFYVYAKLNDGTKINAQAGYAVRNGESITNKIIVIVEKGQRPKVNCRLVYIPE